MSTNRDCSTTLVYPTHHMTHYSHSSLLCIHHQPSSLAWALHTHGLNHSSSNNNLCQGSLDIFCLLKHIMCRVCLLVCRLIHSICPIYHWLCLLCISRGCSCSRKYLWWWRYLLGDRWLLLRMFVGICWAILDQLFALIIAQGQTIISLSFYLINLYNLLCDYKIYFILNLYFITKLF